MLTLAGKPFTMIRIRKKFWRSLLLHFLIYLAAIPLIYYILDNSSFTSAFREEPWWNVTKIVGIALGIALIITLWTKRDPDLRKY